MFTRWILASLPTFVLVTALSAQDMTPAQLTAEVRTLRSQLTQLSNKQKEVETDVTSLRGQVTQISGNVTKSLEAVNESGSQLRMLKLQVDDLSTKINEELQKQQQILDAISEQDQSGQRVPRMSAIMESESFRQNLDTAVQRSIRSEGEFEVTNLTNALQWIQVNKKDYGIHPGATVKMIVPVGTVTTRLPGKEKENWTVTAPTYRQGINIIVEAPAPAPIIPPMVVTGRPMMVNPPVYSPTPAYPVPPTVGAGQVIYR